MTVDVDREEVNGTSSSSTKALLADIGKFIVVIACVFVIAHIAVAWFLSKIVELRHPLSLPLESSFLATSPPILIPPPPRILSTFKGSVPITLVVPCQAEDFNLLPIFLESLANQTVWPQSTHLVLNVPPDHSNGIKLAILGHQQSQFAGIESDAIRQLDENLTAISRNNTASEALKYVVSTRIPLTLSLQHIPNLTLHIRAGRHYAGDNRIYGANVSAAELQHDHQVSNSTLNESLVSFFDCDDYLHPQRMEFVHRTFTLHADLEALIHGFTLIPLTQWDELFPKFMQPLDYMPDNKSFMWSYERIHAALPIDTFANEPQGEPQQKKGSLWFFPRGMDLPRYPPYSAYGHNGWLTVKRRVLAEVEYPVTLPRGQDSLYNWRLIRARRNFNVLPLQLAAYLRQR